MTKINIEAFKRCGPIKSGDSYHEIRKKFLDHQDFKKSPLSKFVTSSIFNGNIHVFYSEHGYCVGVEVFSAFQPLWENINLISTDLKTIKDLFSQRKIDVEISDSGLDIPSLGISLYSHDFDESLYCSVDSVYVDLS